jgi:large subunit ribosomal protein L5
MNLFKTHYKSIVIEDNLLLQPESQIKNLPCIELVVLSAKFNEDFGSAISVLELLGLHKPILTKTKKNNLSLSLKKGEVVGCKLCLRKNNIYTFLEGFVIEILPSIKSLVPLSVNKNSLHWHFSDVFVLDEMTNHYMYLQGLRSLDVVIQTKNASTKFYQGMRFPLKTKKASFQKTIKAYQKA